MFCQDGYVPRGFGGWSQPYYFIVGRHTKWDKKQIDMNSMFIVDSAAMAYKIFTEHKQKDENSSKKHLFEWFLQDSYGKDAFDFCKEKAENPILDTKKEEVEA